MKPKNLKPTEAELEILQVLWESGPSSVRYVNDRMNETREVGYTTTLKLMQIMAEKGLVSRNTNNRTHIYKAEVEEEETQGDLLKRFLNSAFRGSAMKLIMQALGNHNTSKQELQEIKAMIEALEKEQEKEK